MNGQDVKLGLITLRHYEGLVWINKKTGDYYIADNLYHGRTTFVMYDKSQHGEIAKYLFSCKKS